MTASYYIDHLSASSFDMFTRCGEQYRRRYIEHDIDPPGIALVVGSGFHGAAELNFTEKLTTGEDQPLSILQDAAATTYRARLEENGVYIPHEELASAKQDLGDGLDMAVALVKPLLEFAGPVQPALVEHRSALDVEGLPRIVGYVDLYTKDNRHSELKTAKKKWDQKKADTATQPTLYREMIKKDTGSYPGLQTIDVFTKTQTPKYQPVITVRREGDFKLLTDKMKLMMKMIKAGLFPPSDPSAWQCSPLYCGWFRSCPHISVHRKLLPKRSD